MIEPLRILSADDERIAAFRAVRDRDLRGRDGGFIAEGKVVLSVLLAASRFRVDCGLVLDRKLPGLADVLFRWPDDAPLYVAGQDVIDAIAGFHLHRGILAIGRRTIVDSADSLVATLPERALVVLGIGIANHDNVGAILRNAAAFDADAVLLDRTSCDPLYRKAIRVSVGAALQTPFAHGGDGDDLLDILDRAQFTILALSPDAAEELHTVRRRPKRLALVLGTEGPGLPQSTLERLPALRIAMSSRFDSLNVAAASAVALHHFRYCAGDETGGA